MTDQTKELISLLKLTAPGTILREGLDNVLRANTGGLIVIGDLSKVRPIMKGGFEINAEYSAQHLYELAKMDGAIILTKDCKQIISANTHLTPDHNVPSSETGIRHRTAEQTARQTGALVICISQRRRVISLFKGEMKYLLRDVSVLLNTANQALGTLEKYKDAFEEALHRLSVQEFDNTVMMVDVLQVIRRAEMFKRIESMLQIYITELGDEGRMIQMQEEELGNRVEEDERLTIQDYMIRNEGMTIEEQVDYYIEALSRLNNEELLDADDLVKCLDFEVYRDNDKRGGMIPHGYRLLDKIPRLPNNVIDNLVETFENFPDIVSATEVELDDVAGIGPARVRQITLGLERLRSQILNENRWT